MEKYRQAKVEMKIVKGRIVRLISFETQIIWDSEHALGFMMWRTELVILMQRAQGALLLLPRHIFMINPDPDIA